MRRRQLKQPSHEAQKAERLGRRTRSLPAAIIFPPKGIFAIVPQSIYEEMAIVVKKADSLADIPKKAKIAHKKILLLEKGTYHVCAHDNRHDVILINTETKVEETMPKSEFERWVHFEKIECKGAPAVKKRRKRYLQKNMHLIPKKLAHRKDDDEEEDEDTLPVEGETIPLPEPEDGDVSEKDEEENKASDEIV